MASAVPYGTEVQERFWSKVDKRGPDECWPWTGFLESNGYGRVKHKGERTLVHRRAYEFSVGPIPPGLRVDHVCHNQDKECPGGNECQHRHCCNPAHLEPVTNRENVLRGQAGQRWAESTHCPAGHPRVEANVYHPPGRPTQNQCIPCKREATRRWRNQQKES